MPDKVLTVFAGANGSGKSTIVREILASGTCPDYFICPDNLVDPAHKDDPTAYKYAMNKAEQMRETALINGVSFSFETVLSTYEKVDFIRRAKTKGYTIQIYYVLTESVDVNIKRVEIRVSQGGHDVPRDKIISRYDKTMRLMPEVLSLADVAVIYGNTGKSPRRLLFFGDGTKVVLRLDNHTVDALKNVIIIANNLPSWFVVKYHDTIIKAFN